MDNQYIQLKDKILKEVNERLDNDPVSFDDLEAAARIALNLKDEDVIVVNKN